MKYIILLLQVIYKKFLENRILSRWSVLLIDVLIVSIATLFSYVLILQIFRVTSIISHPSFLTFFLISVSWSLLFFLLFRTYIGIIRYSTIHEFQRCFFALISTSVAILGTLYVLEAPSDIVSAIYTVFFLLFSFLGVFTFRTFVIYFFRYFQRKFSGKTTEVYLWGITEDTLSMSQQLNTTHSHYRVRGFIEDGESKLRKNTSLTVVKRDQKAIKVKVRNVLFLTERQMRDNQQVAESLIKMGINLFIMQERNIENLKELKEVSHAIRPIQIDDLLGRDEIEISVGSIMDNISGKTILVTGAAGSIGSEIVRQLAHFKPKRVICYDQAETPLHALSLELLKSKLDYEIIVGDIRRKHKLTNVFEEYRPDIIYHAAAYKHVPLMEREPCEAIMANVLGTKQMVDLAIAYNVEMFVMVSTDKAVNPTNIMGASKRIAEIYVQTNALNPAIKQKARTKFVTTRFGNVLGSNGSVIPLFKKQIANGGPITVTHEDITRYFMTIPEACRLVLEASVIGNSGYIYIFDMGEPVKIYDLASRMIELAGLIPEKDIKIEFSGLRPGEKLYEELLNDAEITEKTAHKKISVAKVREYELEEVLPLINKLISFAENDRTNDLVRCMKEIVPEFISKNSIFESFDLEVERGKA